MGDGELIQKCQHCPRVCGRGKCSPKTFSTHFGTLNFVGLFFFGFPPLVAILVLGETMETGMGMLSGLQLSFGIPGDAPLGGA